MNRIECLCAFVEIGDTMDAHKHQQSRDVTAHEQLKRDELHSKFQSSIDDISGKLQEQSVLEQEKALLAKRLELLTKQAELREQQAVAEENAKKMHIELLETKLLQAATQLQVPPPPSFLDNTRVHT